MREYKQHFRDPSYKMSEYRAKSLCGQYPRPAFTTLDDEKVTCFSCKASIETSYVDAIAPLADSVSTYDSLTSYQKAIAEDLRHERLWKRFTVESMDQHGKWLRHNEDFHMNTVVRIQPYFYMPLTEGELEARSREKVYINGTCFVLLGLAFGEKIIIGALGSDATPSNPLTVSYISDAFEQSKDLNFPWLTLRTNALVNHATWADGSPVGHKIPTDKFDEASAMYETHSDEDMHTLAIKDNNK